MKIVVISHTPYMQTDNGLISKTIIDSLHKHHEVSCIGFYHNKEIFSYNKDNDYFYEDKCIIYPIDKGVSNASVLDIFTLVNVIKPDMIISIGDTFESEYIYAIKNLVSHSFKHINILLIDSFRNDFHDKNVKNLNMSDKIIVTNLWAKKYLQRKDIQSEFLLADTRKIYYKDIKNEKTKILFKCLNSEYNNIVPILETLNEQCNNEVTCIINEDMGDYNVPTLKSMYKNINFYDKYISIYESLSDTELNNIYNSHDICIHLSSKDATSIGIRESMKAGCVPIFTDTPSTIIDHNFCMEYMGDLILKGQSGYRCSSSQFSTKNGEVIKFPLINHEFDGDTEGMFDLKHYIEILGNDLRFKMIEHKKPKIAKLIEKEQNLISDNILRIVQDTDKKILNVFSP